MKSIRSRFNGHGFGLMEVLIAAVLLGILSLGVSQMLSTTFQGTRAVQTKSDFESLVNTIKLILQNDAQCSASLLNNRATPTTAYFYPGHSLPADDTINQISQGSTSIAKVDQVFPTFSIVSLWIDEVDATARVPYGAGRTRYLASMKVRIRRTGKGIFKGNLVSEIPLWVAADDSTHQIVACGTSSTGSAQLVTADMVESRGYAANCDANSTPIANECYCGGLETIHRANGTNTTGSPYEHNIPAAPLSNPKNNQRPRGWTGTITCPAGYVLGAVGSSCYLIAGGGKLENIIPQSVSSAFVSCCVYTPDGMADGTVSNDKIQGICYKL